MDAPALRTYDDLPGPRGLPLLGNALELRGPRMHLQLERWSRDFGPYYRLKVGPRRVLVVGEHHAIAAMLRDRPEGFGRTARLQMIGEEMGLKPGLFGANGDMWRRQRRMVMAGFDPAHIRRYYPALCRVARRLVGRWQAASRDGRAIELQPDLMRYTVDTIAGLAFGAEVNTLQSDEDVIQKHLDKIFPALARRLGAALPVWRWFPSRKDRELRRSMVAVNEAVDGFIAQARVRLEQDPERRKNPPNLLEAMIVAADEPGSGIDDAQVAGNVLTMLLAGEDTTANTIAWMIYLLWQNPQTLARATEEVRRVVVDPENPTQEQLNQLDYVEACANETMRLKPVAPLHVAQPLREATVGNVKVPPDVVVFGLMRHDSVSDQYLAQAADFRPERWLGADSVPAAAGTAKRVSMPFGAGPRICPGRYLALLEMKMAMAMLLSYFEIAGVDTPDGREARERLAFTMAPADLRMRLKAR